MPTIDIDDLAFADLQALTTIAPAAVFYVDDSPDDDAMPVQDGQVVPYVVLHPGIPGASLSGRGIISTRLDPVDSYLIFEVTAPTYAIAKQLGKAINDEFMGKQYPATSEFVLKRRVSGKEVVEERAVPVVIKYALQYNFICNL